jgi:signal transduction histidine kinase/CheY-like chemotaxis protein
MGLTISIELLAGLLLFSGVLALGLLRMVWIQQGRLRQAGQRLRQVSAELGTLRADEQQSRALERDLREIAWHVPVVAFIVRRKRQQRPRMPFLAGDLRALLGLDRSELLDDDGNLMRWPFRDRIHPEDRQALRRHLRGTLRRAGVSTLDFRAYGARGLRWLHLATVAHRQRDGDTRWVGYLIDTTAINTHNQTLRAARDAAERASRAKADFLATMSHEIRTPMNGVIGMLELLGHTTLDADQQELLHAVEDSASVLLQILDDVLDFSKLEAGNLRLDPAPFDPRTLVDNVVGLSAGTWHRKGLAIGVSMDATLAGRLVGDDVRLRQILLNLLGNAGKFTERGRIDVGIQVVGDDDSHQRIRLTVRDTGIGIAHDKQAGLFAPFTQAEAWTARRHGGTGLGLAICRHLVQLMDGQITLDSSPGLGTTVTVELRLAIDRRRADGPPGLRGRHAVVRLASTELAAALGHHLGALGISVETMPPTQPLRPGIAADFLFVDAGEHASARQVAARVIAVDAASMLPAMQGAGDPCVLMGAHPLKWQAVLRACTTALGEPGGAHAKNAAHARTPAPGELLRTLAGGRVLVAEDHPVNQALVRRQLSLLGWSCDVVDDGRAALEALQRNDYDLLLTDCQMPVMGGCELAAAWRVHEASEGAGRHLPIVAMTAHIHAKDVARFRESGMDDHLGKPVQLHALEEKLLAWAAPPARADAPGVAKVLQGASIALPGDMLRLLLATSHDDLQAIEQAQHHGDTQAAARRLHRLVGGLQIIIGHAGLARTMQCIDALATGEAASAWSQLPECLEELRQQLDQLERRVQRTTS